MNTRTQRTYITDHEALASLLNELAYDLARRVTVTDVINAVATAEHALRFTYGIPKRLWTRAVALRIDPARNRQESSTTGSGKHLAVEVVLRYSARRGWWIDLDACSIREARAASPDTASDVFLVLIDVPLGASHTPLALRMNTPLPSTITPHDVEGLVSEVEDFLAGAYR